MPVRYVTQRAYAIRALFLGFDKTAVIYPAAALAAVSGSMLALGMVFYLREFLHATGVQVGGVFAVWSLSYVLGCLFIRPLTDRVLPRRLLATAAFVGAALALGLGLNRWLSLAYVLYALVAAVTSLFWPPLMGWLSADLEGPALNRVISRFNLAWCLGTIVSPPVAGWLSERAVRLPLLVASGLYFANGCMIAGAALALPRVRRDRHTAVRERETIQGPDRGTPLRFPAWVGLVTTYLTMGVIMNIFPLGAREELHFSRSLIGGLFFLRAVSTGLGFVLLGRIAFWHFRGWPMVLTQLALGGTLAWMAVARRAVPVAFALVVLGGLVAFGYANALFHGMAGGTNRAARGAVHEALLSMGMIAGASLGGLLYQRHSMGAAYALCIGLLLLAACVQAVIILWLRARRLTGRATSQ